MCHESTTHDTHGWCRHCDVRLEGRGGRGYQTCDACKADHKELSRRIAERRRVNHASGRDAAVEAMKQSRCQSIYNRPPP